MNELVLTNSKYSVSVGSSDIWMALVSTTLVRVKKVKSRFPSAYSFLTKGNCPAKSGLETAHEINCIRDELASVKPNGVVYDANDLSKQPPWGDDISPVITSCANYFTTADGKDLLAEIVCILVYAYYTSADVLTQ